MENFRPHAKYAPPINIAITIACPLKCKVSKVHKFRFSACLVKISQDLPGQGG